MGAKGKNIRPCHVCGEPVNFVLWESETASRKKRIFHWANPDGSHHIHKKNQYNELEQDCLKHLRSI
jgi:hypothetical protein